MRFGRFREWPLLSVLAGCFFGDLTPVAVIAGGDRDVPRGSTILLDGTSSRNPGSILPLTYHWTLVSQPSASTATLWYPISPPAVAAFVADRAGEYVVSLVVNRADTPSAPRIVRIRAQGPRLVANPGPDREVLRGTRVVLDGSASLDPDVTGQTFHWTLESIPAGSAAVLEKPDTVSASFVADALGAYLVGLEVRAASGETASAQLRLRAINKAPVASAGPDRMVPTHGAAVLDGSGSHDDNGDVLTYRWSIAARPAGSAATLQGADTVTPTFRADVDGPYEVSLTVSDGIETATDAAVLDARNLAPVASAGPDGYAFTGARFVLDGSGSADPNGDALQFAWSLSSRPAGSAAAVESPTSARAAFVPDVDGAYTLQLTVSDGQLQAVDSRTIKAFYRADPVGTVIDAELSRTLGRLVMVSDEPARLRLYDVASASEVAVELPYAPTAVSVGPDGRHAAVGHAGYVSYLDLDPLAVVATLPLPGHVDDVVLPGNGWVHTFEDSGNLHSLEIATGKLVVGPSLVTMRAKLHPNGTAIYGVGSFSQYRGSSVHRFDVSGGAAVLDPLLENDVRFADEPFSISDDGLRLYSPSTFVWAISPDPSSGLTLVGRLYTGSPIVALDSTAEEVATIEGYADGFRTGLSIYSAQTLQLLRSVLLSGVVMTGSDYPADGRLLFISKADSRIYLIVRAVADPPQDREDFVLAYLL